LRAAADLVPSGSCHMSCGCAMYSGTATAHGTCNTCGHGRWAHTVDFEAPGRDPDDKLDEAVVYCRFEAVVDDDGKVLGGVRRRLRVTGETEGAIPTTAWVVTGTGTGWTFNMTYFSRSEIRLTVEGVAAGLLSRGPPRHASVALGDISEAQRASVEAFQAAGGEYVSSGATARARIYNFRMDKADLLPSPLRPLDRRESDPDVGDVGARVVAAGKAAAAARGPWTYGMPTWVTRDLPLLTPDGRRTGENLRVVLWLITSRTALDFVRPSLATSLHTAAVVGDGALVAHVSSKFGLVRTVPCADSMAPSDVAAAAGRTDIVNVSNGIPMPSAAPENGSGPSILHIATIDESDEGYSVLQRQLRLTPKNLWRTDTAGCTPFAFACKYARLRAVHATHFEHLQNVLKLSESRVGAANEGVDAELSRMFAARAREGAAIADAFPAPPSESGKPAKWAPIAAYADYAVVAAKAVDRFVNASDGGHSVPLVSRFGSAFSGGGGDDALDDVFKLRDPAASMLKQRSLQQLRLRCAGGNSPAHLTLLHAPTTAVNIAISIVRTYGADARTARSAALAAAARHLSEAAAVVEYLIACGASLDVVNDDGETLVAALLRGLENAREAAAAADSHRAGWRADEADPVAFAARRGIAATTVGFRLRNPAIDAEAVDEAGDAAARELWSVAGVDGERDPVARVVAAMAEEAQAAVLAVLVDRGAPTRGIAGGRVPVVVAADAGLVAPLRVLLAEPRVSKRDLAALCTARGGCDSLTDLVDRSPRSKRRAECARMLCAAVVAAGVASGCVEHIARTNSADAAAAHGGGGGAIDDAASDAGSSVEELVADDSDYEYEADPSADEGAGDGWVVTDADSEAMSVSGSGRSLSVDSRAGADAVSTTAADAAAGADEHKGDVEERESKDDGAGCAPPAARARFHEDLLAGLCSSGSVTRVCGVETTSVAAGGAGGGVRWSPTDAWCTPRGAGVGSADTAALEAPTPSLSKAGVQELRESALFDVAAITGLVPAAAAMLVEQHSWDVNAAVTAFFEKPALADSLRSIVAVDAAPVSLRPSVPLPAVKFSNTRGSGCTDEADVFECPCCLDDVPRTDAHALACGHTFCGGCWTSHLSEALKAHGKLVIVAATCPEAGCSSAVDEGTWSRCADAASLKTYNTFLLRSFKDKSDVGRACYKCGLFVCAPATVSEATCACGFVMCMSCGQEDHRPAACSHMRSWHKALDAFNNSASMAFMRDHYKQCPKCAEFIEKPSGCRHMTCQLAANGCGHQFCFECGADWLPEGYSHRCKSEVLKGASQVAPTAWNRTRTNGKVDVDKAIAETIGAVSTSRRWETCVHGFKQHAKLATSAESRLKALPAELRPFGAGTARPATEKELSTRGVVRAALRAEVALHKLLANSFVLLHYVNAPPTAVRLFCNSELMLQSAALRLSAGADEEMEAAGLLDVTALAAETEAAAKLVASFLACADDLVEAAGE